MIVSPKHDFVFIAVPKTGTRSIYHILNKYFDGRRIGEHLQTIPTQYKKLFSFCVCRNPYDRVCSAYWSTCKREHDKYGYLASFEEKGRENNLESFLLEIKSNIMKHIKIASPQYLFHRYNDIDLILRFENLNEDFNTLPFLDGPIELPQKNKTTVFEEGNNTLVRPTWQEMVDDKTISLINEIYDIDFKSFDYKKI